MRSNKLLNATVKSAALAAVLLASGASYGAAVDVYLQAQSFSKSLTLPDSSVVNVDMWGFADCTDATFTSCVPATAPGLQIGAAEGDSLTIHLNNALPTPVSIMIPGAVGRCQRRPAIRRYPCPVLHP